MLLVTYIYLSLLFLLFSRYFFRLILEYIKLSSSRKSPIVPNYTLNNFNTNFKDYKKDLKFWLIILTIYFITFNILLFPLRVVLWVLEHMV